MMRTIAIAGALGAALFLGGNPASAQTIPDGNAESYPWCARFNDGSSNCGFVNYEQCRATVDGIGGQCQPNAFAASPGEGVFAGPVNRPVYGAGRYDGPALGYSVGPFSGRPDAKSR